jgi:methyltransferase
VWGLVAVFAVLQGLRVWVIATLGPYWTTRIITLEGAPLVQGGPYRFVRHPNYWVVVGEIAVLPLAFGAWQVALIFSVLNALLLRYRIGIEEGALTARRGGGAS